MKVALLVQRFPHGGAERYVEEIAKRLHAHGDEVTVITSKNNNKLNYDFTVIRLSSLVSIGEYALWIGLENILKKEKFDLVHTNTYGYYHSDRAARLKEKIGYKLVMTSHGFAGIETANLKKRTKWSFIRPYYDKHIGINTLKKCDHLVALSKYDVNFYTNIGINLTKISIIPPGISGEFFFGQELKDFKKTLNAEPVLLSVGQQSWIKNHSLAIKALANIIKKIPNAKLVIIGQDGGELANLIKLSKDLSISNHVQFTGPKSIKEISAYMHSSDLLIHTSLAEGLSTVLLEAMACGLPFITTPAGGNGYLVNESHAGFVTPFNDPDFLSQKILEVLSNHRSTQSSILNGIKYTDSLSWDKVFEKIYQTYQKVIAE